MALIGFRRHVGLIEGKIEIFAHVGDGADTLGEALVDHLKVKALEVVLGWVVLFGIPNIGEGTLVTIRGSGFILVSPSPALRHKDGLFGLGPKGLIVIGSGFAPLLDFGGGFWGIDAEITELDGVAVVQGLDVGGITIDIIEETGHIDLLNAVSSEVIVLGFAVGFGSIAWNGLHNLGEDLIWDIHLKGIDKVFFLIDIIGGHDAVLAKL